MSNDILVEFQQQEAESTALAVQLNRWSLVLIELLIQEHEQKLLAGDLPVDVAGSTELTDRDDRPRRPTDMAGGDNFWEELV